VSKPRRASPSMGDEVHMRLYDMSHGMAKNMSMPLLGRQVRSYLTLPGLWSHREAETPPRRVTRGSCPSYTGAVHTLARMTARYTHCTRTITLPSVVAVRIALRTIPSLPLLSLLLDRWHLALGHPVQGARILLRGGEALRELRSAVSTAGGVRAELRNHRDAGGKKRPEGDTQPVRAEKSVCRVCRVRGVWRGNEHEVWCIWKVGLNHVY
jgi:hypothetical protein